MMRTRYKSRLIRVARSFLVVLICCVSGCVGLAHSSHICTADFPGKYYRATRVDFAAMGQRPLLAPLVLVTDLPFAVVFETIEAPFILAGLTDPMPKKAENVSDQAPQCLENGDGSELPLTSKTLRASSSPE